MSDYKAIIIGGSAGSFAVMCKILAGIRPDFPLPIIVSLHRQKHIRSGLAENMAQRSVLPVVEPYDKDYIERGTVYLAPANYHMFVEPDGTLSLSIEPTSCFCRPAIDYTLSSAAQAYRNKCVGIILTGANKDGAEGLKDIADKGGYTIVQDPETADVQTMPRAALRLITPNQILSPEKIIDFLNSIV